jgi:hypothetical protein
MHVWPDLAKPSLHTKSHCAPAEQSGDALAGALQVPHDEIDLGNPQPSVVVAGPQALPRLAHSTASVSGVHPHAPAVPPPPQVSWVAVQVPQELTKRVAPQLSWVTKVPQAYPFWAQTVASESGMH